LIDNIYINTSKKYMYALHKKLLIHCGELVCYANLENLVEHS
jgi:hypothetical protein